MQSHPYGGVRRAVSPPPLEPVRIPQLGRQKPGREEAQWTEGHLRYAAERRIKEDATHSSCAVFNSDVPAHHRVEVPIEVSNALGIDLPRDAQQSADLFRFLVVLVALLFGQWTDELGVRPKGRVHKRCMDPEQELWIHRGVSRTLNRSVAGIDDAGRSLGFEPRAIDQRQRQRQRPPQPSGHVHFELAVVSHTGGDQRVGDLHQEGAGSSQPDDRLAVDAPDHGIRTKGPGLLGYASFRHRSQSIERRSR